MMLRSRLSDKCGKKASERKKETSESERDERKRDGR